MSQNSVMAVLLGTPLRHIALGCSFCPIVRAAGVPDVIVALSIPLKKTARKKPSGKGSTQRYAKQAPAELQIRQKGLA
jgi:hypothetical protein